MEKPMWKSYIVIWLQSDDIQKMHISSKKKISDCQGLGRMERRKAENRDFRAEGTLYNSIMVGMPLYSCQNQ